jgi:ankyrin repeat protein
MPLLALPAELIHEITKYISAEQDLSFLAQTCRSIYHVANRALYRRNPKVIFWALERCEDTVLRCLSYGVDIHVRNGEGLTPAAVAAGLNDDNVVQMLLEDSGADPNERIVGGRTLLSFAAETNAIRVIELLLARDDINIDPADDRGATPLWYATWSGWPEVLRLLIATGKVNVNATAAPPNLFAADYYEAPEEFDEDFIEPMSMCNAAFRKLQVKLAEDPNEGEYFFNDQGDKQEREEAIALLLAVPELDFPQWHSLLYHTARHGPPEITRLILQRAEVRDLLRRDVNGTVKIFALAAEMGQVGVVDALLEFGVAVDTRDEEGRTPLSLAAERTSYTAVLRRLIANGADVESQDRQGNTPLFYALSVGREENIEILTSHGASLSRITPERITHLVRHAAETANLLTMRYLLAAGVDLKSSQYGGLMPLAHAAMEGASTP